MPTYQMQAPDGQSYRIEGPDGASDEQVRTEIIRQNPHLGGADAKPPTSAAFPEVPRHIPDPLDVAGKGIALATTPLRKMFEMAGQADVAAGIKTPETAQRRANIYANMIPGAVTAALTKGAGPLIQGIAQGETTAAMQRGGLEEAWPKELPIPFTDKSLPVDVSQLISGGLPLAMAGVGRVLRGTERTVTRTIPSRFEAAQRAAKEGAGEVTEQLRPQTAAGDLFRGARGVTGEQIPAPHIQDMVRDVRAAVGKDPIDPGLKLASQYADRLDELSRGGTIDLQALMQLRKDLGASLGRSSDIGGLYKGLRLDLEAAAKAGGPGAKMASEALSAFKADLGADKFSQLVKQATKYSVAGDEAQGAINPATLAKLVAQNKTELTGLLGPEKMQLVTQFVKGIRSLPPALAYTWANILTASVLTIPGALTGGAAWFLPVAGELLNNARLAGQNPAALSGTLNALASGTRAGIAKSGDLAREAARGR